MSQADNERGTDKYRAVILLTTQSIQHRARRYRNLVVVVVIVTGACALGAMLMRSLVPLVGLALLLPICGGFLAVDGRVVERWRSDILKDWSNRSIDITALGAALRANPMLPRMTTEGMLATLPVFGDLVEEQQVSQPSRQLMATELKSRYKAMSDDMALRIGASALAAAACIAAVAMRSWTPLWGLVALAVLPIARVRLQRRHPSLRAASRVPPSPH